MNVMVTGATGHIGNVLIRQLIKEGDNVRAMVLPSDDDSSIRDLKIEIVQGDICNLDSMMSATQNIDTVYHLAGIIALTSDNPDLVYKVNLDGTKNVISACLTNKVKKLVYTSTIHAIAEPPQGIKIDETCPFSPDDVKGIYAKSKALASLEIKKAVEEGLDAVIVCPTGVIGPYDYRVSEMGQVFIDFMQGRIPVYPAGGYDFADVRDVGNGMILAGKKGRKGESYILSGEYISVKDLLHTLADITGKKAPILKLPIWVGKIVGKMAPIYYRIVGGKPIFSNVSLDTLLSNSLISSAKARTELGFTTRPIKESITDSINWLLSKQ
jgi:dihydroflavonol-4-reductase